MLYQTTRNREQTYSFTEMIRLNLPQTGGLFAPREIPHLDNRFYQDLKDLDFLARAKKIFSLFAGDLDQATINSICESAWREDFELGKLPESKILNDYLPNPAFIFMNQGITGTYLDFIHSFLLSILKHVAREEEVWYLLASEKNADIKALLALDFDVAKFIPLLLVNSRNTNNFCLKEMQHIWNKTHFDRLHQQNEEADFTDEFLAENQLTALRIKADIREFERIAEHLFLNQEFRAKLQAENKYLYHMGSLNFAYYIGLIILLISAYVDFLNADILSDGEEFILAFPNNNLDFLYVGVLLKQLGLPINKLSLTCNQNNSTIDFLKKGVLKENRRFFKTSTENLDQIYFSNLERFIFEIVNRDTEKTQQALKELKENENSVLINIFEDLKQVIDMSSVANKHINKQVSDWYLRTDYLFDPYTALVLDHLSKSRQIQFDNDPKIVIPVLEHPLLSSQMMAEAIFSKKEIKRKPYNQVLDMVSEESGLEAPISAKSSKESPDIIIVNLEDLPSELERLILE